MATAGVKTSILNLFIYDVNRPCLTVDETAILLNPLDTSESKAQKRQTLSAKSET